MWLEASVELDRVDVATRVGEDARQSAEARPDLEGDIAGVELGKPRDDAEDVVVDEEVLAERLPGRRGAHARGRPNATLALRSICASSVGNVDATRLREDGERVEHVGRLVSLAAERLRREIRAVRLGKDPIGGNGRRRLPQQGGLRIGHVSRKRHVVPALERRVEQTRGREAVEDDRAGERGQRGCSVVVGVARVDHDGEPGGRGDLELPVEERALHLARSTVMKVVEADLADRDDGRMLEQLDRARRAASASVSPA